MHSSCYIAFQHWSLKSSYLSVGFTFILHQSINSFILFCPFHFFKRNNSFWQIDYWPNSIVQIMWLNCLLHRDHSGYVLTTNTKANPFIHLYMMKISVRITFLTTYWHLLSEISLDVHLSRHLKMYRWCIPSSNNPIVSPVVVDVQYPCIQEMAVRIAVQVKRVKLWLPYHSHGWFS